MTGVSYYLGRPARFWIAVMSGPAHASVANPAAATSLPSRPVPDGAGCLSFGTTARPAPGGGDAVSRLAVPERLPVRRELAMTKGRSHEAAV